jgi:hypothetical protein
MRVALAVNRITADTDTNLKIILNMVNRPQIIKLT